MAGCRAFDEGTGIHDDDVVLVARSRKPFHGDVVVASINGEVSLKLFKNDERPSVSFADFSADTADVEGWGVVNWTLLQPCLP